MTTHEQHVVHIPTWCAACGKVIPADEQAHIVYEVRQAKHGLQRIPTRFHAACCPRHEEVPE